MSQSPTQPGSSQTGQNGAPKSPQPEHDKPKHSILKNGPGSPSAVPSSAAPGTSNWIKAQMEAKLNQGGGPQHLSGPPGSPGTPGTPNKSPNGTSSHHTVSFASALPSTKASLRPGPGTSSIEHQPAPVHRRPTPAAPMSPARLTYQQMTQVFESTTIAYWSSMSDEGKAVQKGQQKDAAKGLVDSFTKYMPHQLVELILGYAGYGRGSHLKEIEEAASIKPLKSIPHGPKITEKEQFSIARFLGRAGHPSPLPEDDADEEDNWD